MLRSDEQENREVEAAGKRAVVDMGKGNSGKRHVQILALSCLQRHQSPISLLVNNQDTDRLFTHLGKA